jgi:hypothetical protein
MVEVKFARGGLGRSPGRGESGQGAALETAAAHIRGEDRGRKIRFDVVLIEARKSTLAGTCPVPSRPGRYFCESRRPGTKTAAISRRSLTFAD